MNLAQAPTAYDKTDQDRARRAISEADNQNIKANQALDRVLFKSPNGTLYYLSVSDAGASVVTAA